MSEENSAWEEGWDGHERAQRRRLAALPLPEKLRWLEEADALVTHLRRARQSPVEQQSDREGGEGDVQQSRPRDLPGPAPSLPTQTSKKT